MILDDYDDDDHSNDDVDDDASSLLLVVVVHDESSTTTPHNTLREEESHHQPMPSTNAAEDGRLRSPPLFRVGAVSCARVRLSGRSGDGDRERVRRRTRRDQYDERRHCRVEGKRGRARHS